MSKAYTGNGKRRSSMTHAKRGHRCEFCGKVSFGNGGKVSHARHHVRHNEAIELVKYHATYPPMTSRLFLAPDDPNIARLLKEGFVSIHTTGEMIERRPELGLGVIRDGK
jgi:hypothetical protein